MDKASPPQDESPGESNAPSILNLVKQVQYQAYVELEAVFQPLGITAVQFRILTTITSRPGLCSADLARIYGVKPQSMIRQIALLEGRELIARKVSSANKRLLELELTAQGLTCLTQCQKVAQALERKFLEPLSSAEQDQLRSTLLTLQEGMNTDAEEFSEEYHRAGVQRV